MFLYPLLPNHKIMLSKNKLLTFSNIYFRKIFLNFSNYYGNKTIEKCLKIVTGKNWKIFEIWYFFCGILPRKIPRGPRPRNPLDKMGRSRSRKLRNSILGSRKTQIRGKVLTLFQNILLSEEVFRKRPMYLLNRNRTSFLLALMWVKSVNSGILVLISFQTI